MDKEGQTVIGKDGAKKAEKKALTMGGPTHVQKHDKKKYV